MTMRILLQEILLATTQTVTLSTAAVMAQPNRGIPSFSPHLISTTADASFVMANP